jgi:hypothetical protein
VRAPRKRQRRDSSDPNRKEKSHDARPAPVF